MTLTRTALAKALYEIDAATKGTKPKGAKPKAKGRKPAKRSLRAELSTSLRKALKGTKLEMLPSRGKITVQHKSLEGPFCLVVDFKAAEDGGTAPVWTLVDDSHNGPRRSRAPGAHGMLGPLQDVLSRTNPQGILALLPKMTSVAALLTQALEAQQKHDRSGKRG